MYMCILAINYYQYLKRNHEDKMNYQHGRFPLSINPPPCGDIFKIYYLSYIECFLPKTATYMYYTACTPPANGIALDKYYRHGCHYFKWSASCRRVSRSRVNTFLTITLLIPAQSTCFRLQYRTLIHLVVQG